MSVTLDGQRLFDDQQVVIEVGGAERLSSERSVGGLDGVLSVDMGGRGRKIVQRGTLRAVGVAAMDVRVAAISALMDGGAHTLITAEGRQYGDVRIESFEVTGERPSGVGLESDYEIVYRQLKV